MNEIITTYSITLKPAKKLWWFALPSLLLGTALIILVFTENSLSYTIKSNPRLVPFLVLIPLIYVQPLIETLWLLTGKVVLTLDEETMTVVRYFMGVPTKTVYQLAEMRDLTVTVNETTSTFFSLGRGRLLGITYKNPVRFTFQYNGSTKKLGNYCEDFPATELRQQIYDRTGRFE